MVIVTVMQVPDARGRRFSTERDVDLEPFLFDRKEMSLYLICLRGRQKRGLQNWWGCVKADEPIRRDL
jgi:hypothetical protein